MFIWKPNSIQGLLHHLHAMWNQVESPSNDHKTRPDMCRQLSICIAPAKHMTVTAEWRSKYMSAFAAAAPALAPAGHGNFMLHNRAAAV